MGKNVEGRNFFIQPDPLAVKPKKEELLCPFQEFHISALMQFSHGQELVDVPFCNVADMQNQQNKLTNSIEEGKKLLNTLNLNNTEKKELETLSEELTKKLSYCLNCNRTQNVILRDGL